MGDRGQVFIKTTGVYLYTHWGASELEETVRQALAKKWRWDDDEYLTRIIFDQMTKEYHGEETGFGIGTDKHLDVWKVLVVDCKNQTVTIEADGSPELEYSFEEFVSLKPKEG